MSSDLGGGRVRTLPLLGPCGGGDGDSRASFQPFVQGPRIFSSSPGKQTSGIAIAANFVGSSMDLNAKGGDDWKCSGKNGGGGLLILFPFQFFQQKN